MKIGFMADTLHQKALQHCNGSVSRRRGTGQPL